MFEANELINPYSLVSIEPVHPTEKKERRLAAPKKRDGIVINNDTVNDAKSWDEFLADRGYGNPEYTLDEEGLVKEASGEKNGRRHVITKDIRSDMEA